MESGARPALTWAVLAGSAVYHRNFCETTFRNTPKSIFLLIFVSQQLSSLSPCSETRNVLTGKFCVDIVVKSGEKWVSEQVFGVVGRHKLVPESPHRRQSCCEEYPRFR